MPRFPQVHWHEGLFLRPQHLQTMQRYLLDQVISERRLAWPHPYGVVSAQLSSDALENSQVQFDHLRAVLPSGVEIDVPDTDDLPALDIKHAFESSTGAFTVFLGVSLWSASRGNAIEQTSCDVHRTKKIYRVAEVERPDENTGENPQPVLVRRVNARLLLEGDDRSDLEVLPLLRITRSTGEGGGIPKMDPEYIPPCLVLKGSPRLFELVRDLANQIEVERDNLARILKPGFEIQDLAGSKLRRLLKLQVLGRFSGRLSELVNAPTVSPFAMYLEWRALLGELSALYPERNQAETKDYDHDNLMLAFDVTSREIRRFLPEEEDAPFSRTPFVRQQKKLVVEISAEEFANAAEFYLCVSNGGEATEVAKLVTNANVFKLMPDSQAFKPIPGIPLEEARHPPISFPTRDNQYFRLLPAKNQMVWDKIKQEGALAVFCRELENNPMDITLYMT